MFAQGQNQRPVSLPGGMLTNPPPTPNTLIRAISQAESLEKRMIEILQRIEQLSNSIGGPRPTDVPQVPSASGLGGMSAIMLINAHIDAAHSRLDSIAETISAIERAIG